MKKLLVILILLITSGFGFSQQNSDPIAEYNAGVKQWAATWRNSGSATNNGARVTGSIDNSGANIDVQRQWQNSIATPYRVPSPQSVIPSVGSGGVNWQANLSANGAGEYIQTEFERLLDLLANPETYEILAICAASSLLDKAGGDFGQTIAQSIQFYVKFAQDSDSFLVNMQNHRYQMISTIANSKLGRTQDQAPISDEDNQFINKGVLSADQAMNKSEEDMYKVIQGNSKNDSIPKEARIFNLIATNNLIDAVEKNNLLSQLKFLYGVHVSGGGSVDYMTGVIGTLMNTVNQYNTFFNEYSSDNYHRLHPDGTPDSPQVALFTSPNGQFYSIMKDSGLIANVRTAAHSPSGQPRDVVLKVTKAKFMNALYASGMEYVIAHLDGCKNSFFNSADQDVIEEVSKALAEVKANFIDNKYMEAIQIESGYALKAQNTGMR